MTAPSILVIDNFDSFTFMLVDYLKTLGAQAWVERNDALGVDDVLAAAYDGVLVSPGPGAPADAGISVALASACVERRRPYLGVCLGHQALALACGSQVERTLPIHGKVATIRHDGTGLFERLPSPFQATRYHSLAVRAPLKPLIANAWSDDGVVMGMRHDGAPAHGVQFHPESIASEQGHAVLGAFLDLCKSGA